MYLEQFKQEGINAKTPKRQAVQSWTLDLIEKITFHPLIPDSKPGHWIQKNEKDVVKAYIELADKQIRISMYKVKDNDDFKMLFLQSLREQIFEAYREKFNCDICAYNETWIEGRSEFGLSIRDDKDEEFGEISFIFDEEQPLVLTIEFAM